MDLVEKVYQVTADFPDKERFGIISQMRRCAVSIPSNIAEGSSRPSESEFKRYLEIAIGSSFELETQLLISSRLSYINQQEVTLIIGELNEIQKQINHLIIKIKESKV